MISATQNTLRLFFAQVYSTAEAFTQTALSQTLAQLIHNVFKVLLTAAQEIKALTKTIFRYNYGKTAIFNIHGLNPKQIQNVKRPAILFLHGDKHNQSAVLPFAEYLTKVKAETGSIFTVNLDYKEKDPSSYREVLKRKILEIKDLYNQQELRLIIVGHSKGAIEGAHLAFCEDALPGVNIQKVISIAGRLKVVNSTFRSCHPDLVPLVMTTHRGIKKNIGKLFNIAGDLDWNAPTEAMIINDSNEHARIVKNHSHVSILYAEETQKAILEFINY